MSSRGVDGIITVYVILTSIMQEYTTYLLPLLNLSRLGFTFLLLTLALL